MSFWNSGTGAVVTGNPNEAFTGDFTIIPNNTMVLAAIKSIKLGDYKDSNKQIQDCYIVIWKIQSDLFKGREVSQKIKVFSGEAASIQRNLNMLKRLMVLCEFIPKHANAPTEQDLLPLTGKTLGVKIREWESIKDDGSMGSGNFVSEIHATDGFIVELGMKMHEFGRQVDSALTRASRAKESDTINDFVNDVIPF